MMLHRQISHRYAIPYIKVVVYGQVRPWSEPIVGSPRVNLGQMVKRGFRIQWVLIGLIPPLDILHQIRQIFIPGPQIFNL